MKKYFLALYIGLFIFSFINFAQSQDNTTSTSQTDPRVRVVNGTVMDAIMQTPELSTISAAITAAGYDGTFRGTGNYTIFAPSNDAVNMMDKTLLSSLMQAGNTDMVKNVLGYHVVSGNYTSADLKDGMVLTTMTGETLMVTSSATGIMINGVPVSISDIKADNGTVHVISSVLLSPGVQKLKDNNTNDGMMNKDKSNSKSNKQD